MRQFDLQIGGTPPEQLLEHPKGFQADDGAKRMVRSSTFIILPNPRTITIAEVAVAELFNDERSHELGEIYAQALTRDMDICPAEVGPHYWRTLNQEATVALTWIATHPIATGFGGAPRLFYVKRNIKGAWLHLWANPTREWHPDSQFLFRLRKSGA